MCFKKVTLNRISRSVVVLAVAVGFNTSVLAVGCDFWGEMAVTTQKDYQAQVDGGTSNPMEMTRELVGYEFIEPDTMGQHYYDEVLAAIESGVSGDEIFAIGKNVCSSYPEGTFDPES